MPRELGAATVRRVIPPADDAAVPVDGEPSLAELVEGELPSAETVAAYEKVLPGAADRIVRILEQQSEHRMQMERLALLKASRTERLSQLLGIGFALVVFVVSTTLITGGRELPGTLLAVADLGLLVAVFLRRQPSSEGAATSGAWSGLPPR